MPRPRPPRAMLTSTTILCGARQRPLRAGSRRPLRARKRVTLFRWSPGRHNQADSPPRVTLGRVLAVAGRCLLEPREAAEKRTFSNRRYVPKAAVSNRSKSAAYSITSSARERIEVGRSRPSALAVFRLITSSYLVGACTGRSAVLALEERPAHHSGADALASAAFVMADYRATTTPSCGSIRLFQISIPQLRCGDFCNTICHLPTSGLRHHQR